MANLAIKGHATRGQEVIEILEMLGGRNTYACKAVRETCFYFIVEGEIYYDEEKYITDEYTIFTLEEFLEQYPYKIGDKVIRESYVGARRICEMRWDADNNCIKYGIGVGEWFNVSQVQPYKEETMEDKGKLAQIDLANELFVYDKIEVLLGDYEFVLKDGKTYFIKKKPQYPKTYEECCKVLMGKTDFQDYSLLLTKLSTKINEANSISPEPPHITLINNFYKLLICRDAYWKIAGKHMDLGKPWEPDWEKADERKYCIVNTEGNVAKWVQKTTNKILAFPTEEMQYAFLENFRDLIESCKELL